MGILSRMLPIKENIAKARVHVSALALIWKRKRLREPDWQALHSGPFGFAAACLAYAVNVL